MTFFRSIVLLASVVLVVAFAYFAGYGLATHNNGSIGLGFVLLLAGLALGFAQVRMARRS